jgi:hypothetical protein
VVSGAIDQHHYADDSRMLLGQDRVIEFVWTPRENPRAALVASCRARSLCSALCGLVLVIDYHCMSHHTDPFLPLVSLDTYNRPPMQVC